MKFIFNSKKWTRLIDSSKDYTELIEIRRNILFSQFCTIGAGFAVLQAIYDYYDGYPFVGLLDLAIGLILVLGLVLSKYNLYRLSKTITILLASTALFIFSALIPKEIGVYLLLFPLILFSFIVLDIKNLNISYGLVGITILYFVILIITDYHPFGDINIQPMEDTRYSFGLNFITSILLLSLGINFLLSLNSSTVKKIVEKQQHSEGLAEELKEKNKALIKTNEELDRFVYSTSHDLKAPLASILGLIHVAELEKDPKTFFKYTGKIRERIESLESFIHDIIDYSKNAIVDINYKEVDLREVVYEVVENNKFLDKSGLIQYTINVEVNKPVITDHNRVFRILNNLVSNGIKYNDLTYFKPEIRISAKVENDNLVLKVADTGKGIPQEIRDNLFEMFVRGNETVEGSGLGLYIINEMISKLEGTISYEDRTGKNEQGTIFTVTLPVK